MSISKWIFLFAVVLLLVASAGAVWYLLTFDRGQQDMATSTSKQSIEQSGEALSFEEVKTTLFGTMLAFNTNEGLNRNPDMQQLLMQGWSYLRADEDMLNTFLSSLRRSFIHNASLTAQTGFASNRDVVGAFVWNVIEPIKGEYDWRVTDSTMQAAGDAGVIVSAVIQPFASWDQVETDADAYKDSCFAMDFGYYDFKAGPVDDWESYASFLAATVERYDGDGEDDMPGLTTRVEAWEIGNEYDGPCGGYYQNPEGYIELLQRSYQTIKQTDPEALVLNAGALEIIGKGLGPEEAKEFWETFFDLGGDQYVDLFNFHYNRERGGAEDSPEAWVEHLDFFNEQLENSFGRKSLWVTEFGTYSGTPSASSPPGQFLSKTRSLPTQSSTFQASWYFRYSVIGFSKGVSRLFIDLEGSDRGEIGASALFKEDMNGTAEEARDFLATLQAMGRILEGFESVEEIADGQYVFQVDGSDVYALWGGSLPQELENSRLVVVGIDGQQEEMDSLDMAFSETSPVLVWRE